MADEPSIKKQVKITTPDIEREIRDESSDDETFKDDRGSEIPTTSQSQRVDISRIQSAYSDRCHSRSNFPLVLDEYGEERDPRDKENKKKKSSKKVSKSETHDDEVQEKRRKKQEELDSRTAHERYIQVMDDLNNRPVEDRFYSKKVAAIATSITKFQDRNTNSPIKSPRAEILEVAKANKKAHKKKERHVLTTNNEHLKFITKTEMAKIVEIQDRLIKEGKLKTQADIDKFREDAKDPVLLNSYTSKSSKQDLSSTAINNLKPEKSLPHTSLAELPPRSLSYISERSSRPDTRQDWAITQQFKHKHEQGKNMTPHQIARQAAQDLEKRFPKTQMPPMKSFTIDLGEKPPDPEELQREIDLKVRIKQRKKFLRKLNRMYQLSMAHNAATNRILEKHGEINQILEGNSLRDVVATLPAPEDAYITEEDIRVPDPVEIFGPLVESVPVSRASTRTNLVSQRGSRENLASQKGSRENLYSRGSSKASAKIVRRQTFSVGDVKEDKVLTLPPPLPLTMDEIRSKAKVIEAKCLSTNWVNYMRSGKPTA